MIRSPHVLAVLLLAASTGSFLQAQSLSPAAFGTQSATAGDLNLFRQTTASSLRLAPAQPLTSLYPPASPNLEAHYSWKRGIVGTVFWVGELPSGNNPVPNTSSSWDPHWMANYGGFDDPEPSHRNDSFCPKAFKPRQNPFYVALPYNDCVNSETTKIEAARMIPWFRNSFSKHGRSVCRDRWIAIRFGSQVCYAQWSDCGPFLTTDANYVFGDATPANPQNDGAGLDMSPAVRDFLGFESGRKLDWRFVDLDEVPEGPWKTHGTNNPFAPDCQKIDANPTVIAYTPKAGSNVGVAHSTTATVALAQNRPAAKVSGLPGLVLKSKSKQ